jgi:hypothetical protein
MDKMPRDCYVRLIIGFLINLTIILPALGAVITGFHYAADIGNSQFLIALIGGIGATISLILTARVFWRGISWQQTIAALLVPMPVILLSAIFWFCIRYWTKGY